MDIVEMPQEDYSADREVEQLQKIPGKRHRACYGGLELYLPYGNRSVFESITGSVAA